MKLSLLTSSLALRCLPSSKGGVEKFPHPSCIITVLKIWKVWVSLKIISNFVVAGATFFMIFCVVLSLEL